MSPKYYLKLVYVVEYFFSCLLYYNNFNIYHIYDDIEQGE